MYATDEQLKESDIYLNPLNIPIDLIKSLPVIISHIGTKDPLIDDNLRFFELINKYVED